MNFERCHFQPNRSLLLTIQTMSLIRWTTENGLQIFCSLLNLSKFKCDIKKIQFTLNVGLVNFNYMSKKREERAKKANRVWLAARVLWSLYRAREETWSSSKYNIGICDATAAAAVVVVVTIVVVIFLRSRALIASHSRVYVKECECICYRAQKYTQMAFTFYINKNT